jgi:hypothetical protein
VNEVSGNLCLCVCVLLLCLTSQLSEISSPLEQILTTAILAAPNRNIFPSLLFIGNEQDAVALTLQIYNPKALVSNLA